MKKRGTTLLAAIILMLIINVAAEAIVFFDSQNIPYDDKISIVTPHFKPVLDGVKDEGYSTTYEVKETTARFHEGTFLSTAWYGNTLYFYLFVPDTSPQNEPGSPVDGPWFLLYFGGDSKTALKWTGNEHAKVFRILPGTERISYEGDYSEKNVFPPADEDFMFAIDYTDDGYTLELSYTVPVSLSTLHGSQEIAFEIEVSDVNDGFNYRYFIANENRDAVINFCTAWGSKLVLETFPDENLGKDTVSGNDTSATDTTSIDTGSSSMDLVDVSKTTETDNPAARSDVSAGIYYTILLTSFLNAIATGVP